MQAKKRSSFYLLTLGCPKNLVDSEGMSELMMVGGYRSVDDPARADVVIVKFSSQPDPINDALDLLALGLFAGITEALA